MGRRRLHVDDAARSKAYRDRVREERIQAREDLAQAERRAEKAEANGCRMQLRGRSESFVAAQKGIALDKANQQGFADSSCVEFYTSGEGEGPAE